MDKGEFHISLWNPIDSFIKTNRTPIGCRERIAAQTRPLFRQWMTTREAPLDATYD